MMNQLTSLTIKMFKKETIVVFFFWWIFVYSQKVYAWVQLTRQHEVGTLNVCWTFHGASRQWFFCFIFHKTSTTKSDRENDFSCAFQHFVFLIFWHRRNFSRFHYTKCKIHEKKILQGLSTQPCLIWSLEKKEFCIRRACFWRLLLEIWVNMKQNKNFFPHESHTAWGHL